MIYSRLKFVNRRNILSGYGTDSVKANSQIRECLKFWGVEL